MVILAAPGCAYSRATGGCTNCGFPKTFGTGTPVSTEELLAQLHEAFEQVHMLPGSPVEVDLYCSGSYLNAEEIPTEAQAALLAEAAARPEVAALLIETRPEYATPEALARAMAAAGGKPLEVAVGLESANEEILAKRIHKGFTWDEFAASAERVAASGARLAVYVLLKPIATGEGEAIEDSVVTCTRVFALGARLGVQTRAALEPCFVAPGTPLHEAFLAGQYRPPWLWSVVEVVTRVAPLGQVLVGLCEEGMDAPEAPHNCELCSSEVRAALARFNRTGDATPLARLECACKARWRAERHRQGT
jgi:hypothetical protein